MILVDKCISCEYIALTRFIRSVRISPGISQAHPLILCRCFKKVLKGMSDRVEGDRTSRYARSETVHRTDLRMNSATHLNRWKRLSPSNAISRDRTPVPK